MQWHEATGEKDDVIYPIRGAIDSDAGYRIIKQPVGDRFRYSAWKPFKRKNFPYMLLDIFDVYKEARAACETHYQQTIESKP